MRVLVVCPVHDPRDARIAEREIGALLAAGHEVTQVGPFSAYAATARAGVRAIDIPRSSGRHRLAAVRAARRVIAREATAHDLIVLHSADAVIAASAVSDVPVVWDVHEDTAESLTLKSWVPQILRAPAASVVRRAELRTERRRHLILAESAYAQRFAREHPVVLNTPEVPDSVLPSRRGRVVYLGSVTVARGGDDLISLGATLPDLTLEIIGPASGDLAQRLRAATAAGTVHWRGFVPNAQALQMVEGATVGLSLLHDEGNYRHSMPTKLLEYLARGVPFVSTPLPLAVDLAERSGGGVIVPFGDTLAARDAVLTLQHDDDRRQSMADRGRDWVRAHANWAVDGPRFVALLQEWTA